MARRTRPFLLALLLALTVAAPATAPARTDTARVAQIGTTGAQIGTTGAQIVWRDSTATGLWWAGGLRRGVQLPAEGVDWFTWDPVRKRTPNRGWRRWGTDRLVRTVIDVLADYRIANPFAPRVGIGDLSRRHGGDFGPRFGGLGHASHQNGLDVDVYYPRLDGMERRAYKPEQVDLVLSQQLVDRFLAAGAKVVYTGPSLGLRGPRKVVQPLVHHDDHLHIRLPR